MDYINSPYVLMLAQELNFTKAAEKLFVSQQNLSAHIKRIEEHYGVLLFERRPAVRLTYAGELFLAAARDAANIESELNAQFMAVRKHFSGRISIGISTNRAVLYAPEFIRRFRERYPGIEVRLVEENVGSLEKKLFANEIDFLIGTEAWESPADTSDINTIVLLHERIFVLVTDQLLKQYLPECYPDCKTAFRKGVPLKTLSDFPMILKASANRTHEQVLLYFIALGIPPKIVVESSSNLALPLARESVGVMICPQMRLAYFQAEQMRSLDSLNVFPLNDFRENHQSVLRYHKKKYIPPYLQDAFEISKEIFQSFRLEA